MKTLTVKIPLSIAQKMDDRAELNPNYLEGFIVSHLNNTDILDKPIQELSYNYTFKIDKDVHKMVKLKSIELELPMNELVGRLLAKYYEG